MGAFTDTLVLIMLAVAAVVYSILLIAALVELARSPYGTYQKLFWLVVLVATGPVGMIIWFSVGLRSARRTHDIGYQRQWRKHAQVNTTVDPEALTDSAKA